MRRVVSRFILAAGMLAAVLPSTLRAAAPKPSGASTLDPKLLKELTWRSIGPANCGGRVSSIAVVAKKPSTIYVGYGTGGVFKTTNGGTTWSTIFDKQPVASIGDIAVWAKNPDVVWAGTGEANSRNSSSWGHGMFRSADGGATWRAAGLEAVSTISRVVPHPSDSNTVYVAALGKLWNENPERGVFKTTDGGKTWSHVLKVDAGTGAVDLVMDPGDPNTLYAAMYTRRRTPWSYTGGGPAGGIFRTRDGGHTWTRLKEGLPASTGRIGLDVYRKNPKELFAIIESDEGGHLAEIESKSRSGGVFRSDDGGDHWKRLSEYAPRPFYFGQIRVQPDDDRRVYLLGVDLWVSDDGGTTFRAGAARIIHSDCHAMWIDPANGDHVMMGTDGGFYVSWDRTANWDFVNNMATGEFYDIALDNRDPFWVYGGLQDNQSWGGPSRTTYDVEYFGEETHREGILNDHWFDLSGGDGFHVAVDPQNPDIVYHESQGGSLERLDLRTHRTRNLRPSNKEGESRFRFNWNTPFLVSPHDPSVLWMGGNRVFKLLDRGDRWELASPDLTTQDPKKMITGGSSAETYCTVVSLTESPLKAGTLWAGTDDGKLWVTTDGGAHWSDLTASLKGVSGFYVSGIEASHHDPRTAFVAIDGHRSDDMRPHLFVTRDLGRSWSDLSPGLPADGPVIVVREGLVNPSLLFAGTEFGIWTSVDAGAHWSKLDNGLPTVAVDDIQIHPRDHDLVIGTHGRSIWVMDDITPLENWKSSTPTDSATFFPPRGALAFHTMGIGGIWGSRMFRAKNPPFGAYLDYYLGTDFDDGVSFVIADSAGKSVRKLSGPGTKGLHRVTWELQAGDPKDRIGRPEWAGQPLFVRPGKYTVTMTAGSAAPIKCALMVRELPGTGDPAR